MGSRGHKPKKLEEVLRAFPETDLAKLMDRLGIRVDPAKRLDAAAQAARALVALPDLRDTGRLPPPSVELLHRVSEAKGTLFVASIPPALEPLVARGLMFARQEGGAYELIVPAAYLLQLRSWEGEDPRGIRALLAQASFETTAAIASHYLGRTAAPPIALALETAWDVLSDPRALAAEIERLAPSELRVLETVEQEGGEVDTEELLEIEREPLRLRTASGVSPSRSLLPPDHRACQGMAQNCPFRAGVNELLTLTKPNAASGAGIPFRLTFALTPITSHAIPNHPVEFSAAEFRHRPQGGDGRAVAREFDLERFG